MNESELYVLFTLAQIVFALIIFTVIFRVGKFAVNYLMHNATLKDSALFNIREYFPEEEIPALRQIYYLSMILIFTVTMLYILCSWGPETVNIAYIDIILSCFLATKIKPDSLKHKLMLFALVPFGSINFLIFGMTLVNLVDLIHAPLYLYFVKMYYHKFVEFTETNSLGITIILLYSIIFISFIVTMIVENVSPLNSLVMVSNAFTSNGYSILGSSGWGKINSLVLVWSGFLLSGVGTATLTVAIVMKHVDKKFDRLEKLVKKNK